MKQACRTRSRLPGRPRGLDERPRLVRAVVRYLPAGGLLWMHLRLAGCWLAWPVACVITFRLDGLRVLLLLGAPGRLGYKIPWVP